MKKLLCLLLSLVMLLSLAACGGKSDDSGNTQEPAKQTEETAGTTEPEQTVEPVDSFYMDLKELDQEEAWFLQAYGTGEGTVYVEYNTASGRKATEMDPAIMEQLTQAYERSGLSALNGQDVYDEGDAYCSAYISRGRADCAYSYYGPAVPEAMKTEFDAMAAVFVELLSGVEEYVAQPQVDGEVDEAQLEAIMEILNGSGIAALDSLAIMNVLDDEYYGYNTGLSGSEGITDSASCMALMMTVPYSLVVVTVEEGTDPNAVATDFAANIDWAKWVCVQPSNATIAVNGSMVLCLLGQDEMYTGTAAAIESAGWTVVEELKNPNL